MQDPQSDVRWGWVTITLSIVIALGYAITAFNWYCQKKLGKQAECKIALCRLRNISLCSVIFCYLLANTDLSWPVWRLYDVALFLLALYTWSSLRSMRGLSLVNERLAQADELERSAQKYREIAEFLPLIIWTATADGDVDFSNDRWSQFARGTGAWPKAVHPDQRDEVINWWKNAVREREPVSREVKLAGSDGYRTFIISATPLIRGGKVKWLGACADIQAQKLLEAQKEIQAKQKLFLLNSLSHDLRAPLNTVTLNAHLLKLSARNEEEVDIANVVIENAMTAAHLIGNLLELARADAQEKGTVDTVAISPMLRQILRRFQPLALKKNLYLRLEKESDLCILTDRVKVERIVGNLVDNAVKYTENGGVTIRFAMEESGAAFAIRDTGTGIPQENIPSLFEEFYQANNPERDPSKGFGMGLAICRSLALQINGDVRLADTGPQGSCFELILQTAAQPVPSSSAEASRTSAFRNSTAAECVR
jgi:two-component system, sensor histidine kinase